MNKRKVIALLCAGVLAASMMLIGCTSKTESTTEPTKTETEATTEMKLVKEGVLTVGSDCDYPPFISMSGDEAVGFEVELMEAIGDHLGLQVEYLPPQKFDTILASVAAGGKMDIGVSSFTINDERKKMIDFCTPYFDSNQAVVALKSKAYANAAALAGLKVGAQSGTTGYDWVKENIPTAELVGFDETSQAVAAVVSGQAEAAVYDEPVAGEHVTTSYSECEIIERVPTGEQYGFAVAKENPALKEAVNKALVELKANGTFDQIFEKYFPGVQPPAIKG